MTLDADAELTAAALQARKLGLRFALKYAAIAGAAFAVYCFPYELLGMRVGSFSGYLAAYAHLAGFVLGLFEPNLVVAGTRIDGRFSLEIVKNCDAIEVNILFASAIAAFPAPLRRRLVALVAGVALLVVANVLRIVSLYYVGVYRPSWFEALHLEVWPLVLIAFAALSFLCWVRFMEGRVASDEALSRA